MKILRAGKIPEEREAQTTCRNCDTLFSCVKKDGREVSDRDGNFVTVECPLCKKPVHIQATSFMK